MRKKRKVPTLPNGISPIMPDFTKGIEKFNQSANVDMNAVDLGGGLAEDLDDMEIDNLKRAIIDTTISYMVDNGFEEDDARAYSDFEFEDEGDRIRCEVRGEFGLDEMGELSQKLNGIVCRYDPDAYFDFVTQGILQAYIHKDGIDLFETLQRMDRNNRHNNDMYSDLFGLYEAMQDKLSAEDKDKLAEFVKKTDDVDEIETYMQGLKHKDKNESYSEHIVEQIDTTKELDDEFYQYGEDCRYNIEEELPDDVKTYLDEITSGVWVNWGKLPSGTYFFADEYDTSYFDSLQDFISDMRYDIKQVAEMYRINPEDYDFSDKFLSILGTPLTEGRDDVENPMVAPIYDDGPEPPGDADYELEVNFVIHGNMCKDEHDRLYFDISDNDYDELDYEDEIWYDGEYTGQSFDEGDVVECTDDALWYNGDDVNNFVSSEAEYGDIVKLSGTVYLPYEIDGVYWQKDDYDYRYDFSDMKVKFYTMYYNNYKYKFKDLNVEVVGDWRA